MGTHQNAGFAGVWAFVVTAPTSWPLLFLAAVLGAAYRRLSARLHHHAGTSGA
ncbi:hypothetical protein [Streptomyces sp. NPDC001480]|uniref:SCO4225 family membrane protein n=1 Tax=Streptomyces sp. NPDC001480 TaxID=3364577 RepID=UPI0036A4A8D0